MVKPKAGRQMKHLLLTTIAAAVLVGCGSAEIDRTLIAAIARDDIEVVKQHLAAGADVNVKNKVGGTPLHFAALEGRKAIVELLITKGAQVNVKSEDGLTPLDRAIKYQRTETANLLRKLGGKTGAELRAEGNPTEPVAEAAKIEPPTAKTPVISIHNSNGSMELRSR